MASYRGVIIGPEWCVNQTLNKVCQEIHDKDSYNIKRYGKIELNKCFSILDYTESHDHYPFLYLFENRSDLLDYLEIVQTEGYDEIIGKGFHFICYHISPKSVFEDIDHNLIEYTINEDGDVAKSPFSYDPGQDFITEI